MSNLEKINVLSTAKKVMSQANNGVVRIGEWKFCVNFDLERLKFQGLPLNLSDNNFLLAVGEYLKLAREFYSKDKDYYELNESSFDEKLFMDLFVNMTNFDIENVEKYLQERTVMLKSENNFISAPKTVGQILDADIEVSVLKNTSNLEAPLRFRTMIKRGDEFFLLPDISFGVADDCLHMYAIQRKKDEQKNATAKKFDRYFRKFNKDVDMDDEIISQVSTNALASITIFLAYFKKQNIQNVKAYGFMPFRYNSKVETAIRKYGDESQLEDFLEKNDKNQFNITNKLFNTVLRYAHHFGERAQYDENRECLDMQLTNSKSLDEDNVIQQLDEAISSSLIGEIIC